MVKLWSAALCLVACSSTSGTPEDAGTDTGTNGCTDSDFVDASAITWDFQVSPRCVHVAVNQTVTWTGDFSVHPLAPLNGDTPNPITSNGATGSVTIKFPSSGTFGFHCVNHATMLGAVRVGP